jgi:subtilisin family serine protease
MLRSRSSSAVATALLFAFVTAAAGAAAPIPVQRIPLERLQKSAGALSPPHDGGVRQGRPGGLNQQIERSGRAKFVAEPDRTGVDVYLVRLRDLPVATYDGRVRGYTATAKSRVVNSATAAEKTAASYRSYLRGKQQQVLAEARRQGVRGPLRRQLTEALNAFSIEMTQRQAQAIARLPQVAQVQRSTLRQMHTDRGPAFVGAPVAWNGGTASALPYRGEGMLVGIIDSGANTDHPSFAAVGGDGYAHINPRGAGNYLGDCATGAATCNAKLIGVWSWPVITDDFGGLRPPSGEDYNGHGSHTASTAAGNVVHDAPLLGGSLGDGDGTPTGFEFDTVSGVAPHANLISYQVCFPNGGCPDEAIVTAIDQAIQDGVDVINFSIGGGERQPWADVIALAFLSAREAGIAVAASAGNAGSNFYTLSHVAPWYLSVAASTHDRVLDIPMKTLSLSGGAGAPPEFPTFAWTEYGGISATGISGALVDAGTVGDELCAAPFAAGTFSANQIVVCKRGTNARVAKAANVKAGGAGGFVLVNAGYPLDDDDLLQDVYPLPGIQLRSADGSALLGWMADGGAGHSATISATAIAATLDPAAGDQLADFSSRGPAASFGGHLSPGISAPGVSVFGAYADEHPFHPDTALSRDWELLSGTSMASPHVAGAMALIRQAHPEWSAAEVQSALQMTAVESVSYGASSYSAGKPAGIYRAGAGRLDVPAAIDAGLVMDESAANFEAANPANGGDVLQLNLPQLVNSHCRDVCSWIRTVKATRDGSWTVSTGDWTFDRWTTGEGEFPQNGIKLEAFPSSFTLAAGETQTILLRVDLSDAQFRHNGFDHVMTSEELELWSKLILTPADAAIPSAHWPISINFDHGALPKTLDLMAYRDQGAYRLNDLQFPALAGTNYRGYGLVKPTVETVALHQDSDHVPPMFDGDYGNDSTRLTLIDVPADTARLVIDVIANAASTADAVWKRGWATVYVGLDSNDNGEMDYEDELLCASNTEVELNYCSLTQPDAGRYWVLINNARTGLVDFDPEEVVDTYRIATAIVPGSVTDDLQISGPAATTGVPIDLDVNWTLPPLAAGEVVYGGFDAGSANAPGSIGFVPVKITRGLDDVSMTLSQSRARVGDIVDVAVHVRENASGADRSFVLESLLPDGLTLVPGSVHVNTAEQRANLSVSGNTIMIAGTQPDSEHWVRDYQITTSATDALCRTPIFSANGQVSTGGFVGLVNRFGLLPDFGGHADVLGSEAVTIPLADYWGDQDKYSLYNNDEFFSYPELRVSPQGWVIMEPNFGDTMFIHRQFPYLTFPYTPMIGVLWKGSAEGVGWFGPTAANVLSTPLDNSGVDLSQMSGMTVAYGTDSHDLVFEWVGARTEHMDFDLGTTTTLDDSYDFELLLNRDYRFGDGEYEIQMAYDNLDFGTQPGKGSIGVQGYHGPLTTFGPLDGDLAVSYAFDDLQDKLSDDLVVCYDYRGPESTQYDLRFQVRVSEFATGTDLTLGFNSQVQGMPARTIEANLAVAGNLTLAAMTARTVVENTTLAGIPVLYQDADAGPNVITVSGDHVAAVVHGHTPGSTFDLIPEANFVGTTLVTVTVSDESNPSDRASTTFLLTVTPGVDIEIGIFADGFD